MKTAEKTLAILLISMSLLSKGQDSLTSKSVERPNELGIGVLSTFFLLASASDYNERYTNLTYRHFISKKHALKAFVGISPFRENDNDFKQTNLLALNQTTISTVDQKRTPSNFQVGIGYEYIIGKRKLKHVIGVDVLYNNKFESNNFYYNKIHDSIDVNGKSSLITTRLDTGAYTKNYNYDKLGLNLSYSLRYEFSKRWLITASAIGSFKFYKRKGNQSESTNFDFNLNGLISDISLYYRFR